jgi:hypothetical protein
MRQSYPGSTRLQREFHGCQKILLALLSTDAHFTHISHKAFVHWALPEIHENTSRLERTQNRRGQSTSQLFICAFGRELVSSFETVKTLIFSHRCSVGLDVNRNLGDLRKIDKLARFHVWRTQNRRGQSTSQP